MSSGYHIAVIGSGAMGSLFAGRLCGVCQTGDNGDQTSKIKVTMIGSWREQIEAIRNNGLQIIHPDGRTSTHRPNIAEKEDVIDPADFALVLVKSHQTATAAEAAKNSLK
ncbi:MAG: 2-dehydropantoate 2-reductase N-terminal domain-containing protein, partial [candidate division KSB1 bacterium]|nr:2-dehydropantoate 2-reductase N-terminal domain-containing protein [candidate division KSB1 bacterium]